MSNFLRMLPRRLPVALADYVAVTGEADSQRRAIAERIYASLPSELQAETSRIYEAMSAKVERINSLPGGGEVVAFDAHCSKRGQRKGHH